MSSRSEDMVESLPDIEIEEEDKEEFDEGIL